MSAERPLDVVAERPVKSRRRPLAVLASGLVLVASSLAFFGWFAARDHHAVAHGVRSQGTVVAVLSAHTWDPFDGGRLDISYTNPSGSRTARIWTDHDATRYRVGDAVTVIRDGSVVRTDQESNDPAPLGLLAALIGLAGVAGVLVAAGQLLSRWRARRHAAMRAANELPLHDLARWETTGPVAWSALTTQTGWNNYSFAAAGCLLGGLALALVAYMDPLPGRAEDLFVTLSAAGAIGAFVMARRLRCWRRTLQQHAWQTWSAEAAEVDSSGSSSTTYARMTTDHAGRRVGMVCRCQHSDWKPSSGMRSGTIQLVPDTWSTVVVLDGDGKMRRFTLPRTQRARRRWNSRLQYALADAALVDD